MDTTVIHLGSWKIVISPIVMVAILGIFISSIVLSIANEIVPWLFGTSVLMALPPEVQFIANVVSSIAGLFIWLIIVVFLTGWARERFLDRSLLSEAESLLPISDAMSESPSVLIAPNLDDDDRSALLATLQTLASRNDVSAVLVPIDSGSDDPASSDKVIVITTMKSSMLRRLCESVKGDAVCGLGRRDIAYMERLGVKAKGRPWLLVWD